MTGIGCERQQPGRGGNLAGQNLTNANFSLRHADQCQFQPGQPDERELLCAPTLTDANLSQANLTNADLRVRATLTNANLSQANLTNANFTSATLTGANLTGAEVRGANFSSNSGGVTRALPPPNSTRRPATRPTI